MFVNFGFDDVKYFTIGMIHKVTENETVRRVGRKVTEAVAGTAASFIVGKKLNEWFNKPKKVEAPAKVTEEVSEETAEVTA